MNTKYQIQNTKYQSGFFPHLWKILFFLKRFYFGLFSFKKAASARERRLTLLFSKGEGFTLIELMIVMSMVFVLAIVGTSDYLNTRNKKVLDSTTERIAADIRATMERSKAQEDGNQWGIRFWNQAGGSSYYDIWKGLDYSSGIIVNKVQLDATLNFSNPTGGDYKDFCFAKSTGLPIICGAVAIANGSSGVTGTGTSFTKDFGGGDIIRIPGWSYTDLLPPYALHIPKVFGIANDNSLTLDFNYTGVSKSGLNMPLQNGSIVVNSKFKDSAGSVFVNANGRVNTQIEYGIVGYWSMDEKDGNISNDYSGNGNAGAENNTTIINGKVGRARNFNDAVNKILINDNSSLNITNAGTFELWVKPDPLTWATTTYNAFLDKAPPLGEPSYRVQRYMGTNELEFFDGESSSIIHGGTITPDSWNHIVVTVNKGTAKGYINGIEVFSEPVRNPLNFNTNDVLIGNSSEGDVFYGIIDEVKIYNRVLGAEEILDHYNENK